MTASRIDVAALSAHSGALEGFLTELETFRGYSEEEFLREPAIHHLAERFLQLACEALFDTARHVVSDTEIRSLTQPQDTMRALEREGLVEPALARRLEQWMAFRTDLIHRCVDLDHAESYQAIQQNLGDLRGFLAAMSKLLPEGP